MEPGGRGWGRARRGAVAHRGGGEVDGVVREPTPQSRRVRDGMMMVMMMTGRPRESTARGGGFPEDHSRGAPEARVEGRRRHRDGAKRDAKDGTRRGADARAARRPSNDPRAARDRTRSA